MLTCLSDYLYKTAKKIEFSRKNAWGYLVSIDISDCNPEKIRDKKTIEKYIKELSKVIDCHLYGPPIIARIGEGERLWGFSFVQLVTTSSLTGHFVEDTNSAYIDIFFCNYFDPDKAVKFTQDYFEAKKVKAHTLTRGSKNE